MTFAGSPPAHPMMHAAIWPIVNMPWAMMPSKPTERANASSRCSGFRSPPTSA